MTNTGMAMGVQPNVPVYQQTMQEVQLAPVRLLSVNEELPTKQRVRFQGETFAQLKQRLVTAAVPGENVRVLVDDEWTVLLDEDALPNGDLHIRTMDAGMCQPSWSSLVIQGKVLYANEQD